MALSLPEMNFQEVPNAMNNNANLMTSYAQHIGLDVYCSSVTPGDGSCWYHAVVEQIHRRQNFNQIEKHLRFYDAYLLRQAVVGFINKNESTLPYIQQYKALHINNEIEWRNILQQQENSTTFASTLFCLSTAKLLNVEIRITTLQSTRENPYYSLNVETTSGVTFIISNITNLHFQSLIPIGDVVLPPSIELNDHDLQIVDSECVKEEIDIRMEKSTLNPVKQEKRKKQNYQKKKMDSFELQAKEKIFYIPPPENETYDERKLRIKYIRQQIDLQKQCNDMGVTFINPSEDETDSQLRKRIRNVKNKLRYLKQANNKSASENDCQQSPFHLRNDPLKFVHTNPKVISSMKMFEEGEDKHTVATCKVCKETRPVFNSSCDVKFQQIKMNPWTIDKKGMCKRCKTDKTKRIKLKINLPAKFSGCYSEEADMGQNL